MTRICRALPVFVLLTSLLTSAGADDLRVGVYSGIGQEGIVQGLSGVPGIQAGELKNLGAFNLSKPTTVLEAVAMAHGVNHDRGSPSYCMLKRRVSSGPEQLIPIDLEAIRKGKKPNLYLEPNDIIDVRQTWLKGFGIGVGKVFGGIGMGLGYSLN